MNRRHSLISPIKATGALLRKLASDKQKGILFSTHDLSLAAEYCDRFWIMTPDGVFHQGTLMKWKTGIIEQLY